MQAPRVYLITERRPDLVERVRRAISALPPGSAAVQLRDKQMPARDLLALARQLASLCHERGHLLLVNDRLDVALAAGADGAHLPSAGVPPAEARQLLGPSAWVGVSCHCGADVRRALEGGADFAMFGPVFDTPSKRAYGPPAGLGALREAAALGLPLVALGGIDAARARAAAEAGAQGVAAIRAWIGAPDPAEAARALLEAVR
jgi:thiamine-phosphate pyrophosphorylase